MKEDKSILLELHYLPCIQYFSKLLQYECTVIEQHENYIKGGYRNRTYIAAANGPLALSIPLQKGKNQQQGIHDVKIAYNTHWQSEHWTSIKSAYGSSPYFEHYSDGLQVFYKTKYTHLFEFNMALLEWVLKKLRLEVNLNVTSSYEHRPNNSVDDWRNGIHPKAHRQKEDPNFEAQYYAQVFEEKHCFLANLSILDLLFCSGPQGLMVLEGCFVQT